MVALAVITSPVASAAALERRVGPAVTAVELGTSWEGGVVPPFRLAPRDRWRLTAVAGWAPAPQVSLHLSSGWVREQPASGPAAAGPDGLSVLGRAHLLRQPERPLHLALGFLATAPLATAPLATAPHAAAGDPPGSGESDVDLLLEAGRDFGPGRLDLVLGLAIRGSSLHPAEQDDAAVTRLHLALPAGPLELHGRVGGTWGAPVEAPRMQAVVGLSAQPWRCGPTLAVEGGAGLSPAAADGQIGGWIRQPLAGTGPCRREDGD